ncbi:MAG TPA: Holliday junction branch migration protein RuvA [Candidatus Hypogeohydataceae bacterium YC41]
MIRYLKGTLLEKEEDRIVVLNGGVGYEVRLPFVVRAFYNTKEAGQEVELYISYQQSERQPKPLLIGFNTEAEREFFEKLITVDGIGPSKAIEALTMPVARIARAIEDKEISALEKLKGIGRRSAEKIVAELHGKVAKYALMTTEELPSLEPEDLRKQVEAVLVKQLGHKPAEASQLVIKALQRNPKLSTPEELFEEVYRGQRRD